APSLYLPAAFAFGLEAAGVPDRRVTALIRSVSSGDQVPHGDIQIRERKRGDAVTGLAHQLGGVRPCPGIAIDLEDVVDEIDDPVVGDPRLRVEMPLDLAIEPERAVRHFDHQ